MNKNIKIILGIIILICIYSISNFYVFANDEKILDEYTTVYVDDVVYAGKDDGYSKNDNIEIKDVHYGWKLGKFAITDFSSKRKDSDGNWVLLKNANDQISLYFILLQDINKLDNDDKLGICNDENGYDNEFNIKKTNFGKGTLIIRKIDSTGNKNEPIIYTNYLNGITVGANTKVDVFEEGDYEVALDYEIRNNGVLFFDNYTNYRIRFNFSVRNGNTMIFPYDVVTKNELKNTSITENGFYLDLANSKYLNVNIKKEILSEGLDGLVEDTRFNKPAKSGLEYTDEGIYTISAENTYTGEKIIKKIYVGNNELLKAHVQNSEYSISQINDMISKGANIDENGIITNIPKEYRTSTLSYSNSKNNSSSFNYIIIFIPVILCVIFIIYKIFNKKNMNQSIKVKIEQKNENIRNKAIDEDEKFYEDSFNNEIKNEMDVENNEENGN